MLSCLCINLRKCCWSSKGRLQSWGSSSLWAGAWCARSRDERWSHTASLPRWKPPHPDYQSPAARKHCGYYGQGFYFYLTKILDELGLSWVSECRILIFILAESVSRVETVDTQVTQQSLEEIVLGGVLQQVGLDTVCGDLKRNHLDSCGETSLEFYLPVHRSG